MIFNRVFANCCLLRFHERHGKVEDFEREIGIHFTSFLFMAAPCYLRSRAIALTLRAGLHSLPLIS